MLAEHPDLYKGLEEVPGTIHLQYGITLLQHILVLTEDKSSKKLWCHCSEEISQCAGMKQ